MSSTVCPGRRPAALLGPPLIRAPRRAPRFWATCLMLKPLLVSNTMQNLTQRGNLNPKGALFCHRYKTFAPQREGRPRVSWTLGHPAGEKHKTVQNVASSKTARAGEKDAETRSSPSFRGLSRGEFGSKRSSTRQDGNPGRLNGEYAPFQRFQQVFSARFGHVVDGFSTFRPPVLPLARRSRNVYKGVH